MLQVAPRKPVAGIARGGATKPSPEGGGRRSVTRASRRDQVQNARGQPFELEPIVRVRDVTCERGAGRGYVPKGFDRAPEGWPIGSRPA